MKGKTVIITGGARGIGKAAALKLASLGANLVINYLGNDKAASETEEACKQLGAEILLIKGDVASAEQCEKIAAAALERFGRIDVLINNAGITRDGLLMRMEEKDFDSVINTNLKGTFLMTKAVSRQMLKQRYGRIINMASVVGITGNQGQANYSASRGNRPY